MQQERRKMPSKCIHSNQYPHPVHTVALDLSTAINKIRIYIFCYIMNPTPGLLIDTEYEALKLFKHYIYLKISKTKLEKKGVTNLDHEYLMFQTVPCLVFCNFQNFIYML